MSRVDRRRSELFHFQDLKADRGLSPSEALRFQNLKVGDH